MKKIALTVDSGICPIIKEDTVVIPAQIVSDLGNQYADNGKEITNQEILTRMEDGEVFKTSSPLPVDYENAFRSLLNEGYDVVHLSMSSGISAGSINASRMVADIVNDDYENQVSVLDTHTGATGGTLFYEKAYELLQNGNLPLEEYVAALETLKQRLQTSFYVPNPEGFLKSGRDKSASHVKEKALTMTTKLAFMAGLKYRVDFHDEGDLFLKRVFRSNAAQGMYTLVKDIVNPNTIERYESNMVVVGNLNKEKVDLEEVKQYLKSFQYFDQVLEKDIGSVVAVYGCNDLCGISLIKKRN